MNINIKATNMELTNSIEEYVKKRVESASKFLNNQGAIVYVEVGKTTNHHKNGEFYKTEIKVNIPRGNFFAMAETDDLYSSIDMAKSEIVRELTTNKDRASTLFKRGARSVKKMLKGLTSRNPLTSKY